MPQHKKGRNGDKTHGRNKVKCANYRSAGRRRKNKLRRLRRRLRGFRLTDSRRQALYKKEAARIAG